VIEAIRQFFSDRIEPATGAGPDADRALQLATAALLIEMSQADFSVSKEEKSLISEALRETFELDDEHTAELVRLAEGQAQQATCLYEFTSLVNKSFDRDRKLRVVELLWQVAYADGRLEKHEHHLMRRLANLLHLSHQDYIAAKFRARDRAARISPGTAED
jgi:uncharacterized tellurite resistance protein B-like protein